MYVALLRAPHAAGSNTAKTKHSYIFKKNKAFLEDNNPALVLQR